MREYVGGYSDWVRQGHRLTEVENPCDDTDIKRPARPLSPSSAPQKLGYNDQRELERLPRDIEDLERAIGEVEVQMSAVGFYARDYDAVQAVLKRFNDLQATLDARIERWTELTDRQERYERARRRGS